MKIRNLKFNQGFTLIELMVTLVISAVLLAGTINVLINNFSISRANDRYARLNENTLMATTFIAQDIENAGLMGCATSVANNVASTGNGDLLHLTDTVGASEKILFLDGLDDSNKLWSRFGTNQIQSSILDGTDAITIRRIRIRGDELAANMTDEDSNLNVNLSGDNVEVGDLIAISDCRTLDLAEVVSINTTGGNTVLSHNGLSNVYSINDVEDNFMSQAGRVALFDTVRYFIGTDANGQAGLWREILPGNTPESRQELIKGIEDLQILYGVGADASNNYTPTNYVRADQITTQQGWQEVVSIKFAMLVTSNYVSTTGNDSLQNQEDNQDFLDYKNAQIALGAQHELLDKSIPWQADNVVRRVITREVFLRNIQMQENNG